MKQIPMGLLGEKLSAFDHGGLHGFEPETIDHASHSFT
jgi:hypothetical protein